MRLRNVVIVGGVICSLLAYGVFKIYQGPSLAAHVTSNVPPIYQSQFVAAYKEAISMQDAFDRSGTVPSSEDLKRINQLSLSHFKSTAWFQEGVAAGRDQQGILHPYGGVIRFPAEIGNKLIVTGGVPSVICEFLDLICEQSVQ